MANMNSSYTKAIGQGIMDMLQEKEVKSPQTDTYRSLDNISVTVYLCCGYSFSYHNMVYFCSGSKDYQRQEKIYPDWHKRVYGYYYFAASNALLDVLCL
jgi:hypothetical protein